MAALDLERVEGIAFIDPEFAPDDLVAGRGVTGNVDPFDVDARRLTGLNGDVHQPLVGSAIIDRADVGEGIAKVAGCFLDVGYRIFDLLGVEPGTGDDLDQSDDLRVGKVAQGAVGLDGAEFVARPFLDYISDDEVAAVGGQLGKRRDDAEIGIALGEIEGAQLLLVGG